MTYGGVTFAIAKGGHAPSKARPYPYDETAVRLAAYAETGQFEKAVEPLHKAITLEPNNAGAHANLAWAYAGQQQWTLAVQEAEKATALDATNPYAFATLGWALKETGQNERAMTALIIGRCP